MYFNNILLLYGFLASSYVVYKVILYRTDIYSFGKVESFLFFFALVTGSLAMVVSLREIHVPFFMQKLLISLIFLSVSIVLSLKRFFYLKGDKDLVQVVHRSIWAIVIFSLIVLTLLSRYYCEVNANW